MLTRFLASSTPVIYWISGHILLSCEPLLKENKNFAYGQRQNTLGQSIYNFWTKHLCIGNPITQLLMCWRTCSFPTHCILGYFISYWLLGLALHCNFLPWTWQKRYGHICASAVTCLLFVDSHEGLLKKIIFKCWLLEKISAFCHTGEPWPLWLFYFYFQ